MRYLILALIVLAACAQSPVEPTTVTNGDLSGHELQKFDSLEELQEYVQQSRNKQYAAYNTGFAVPSLMERSGMIMNDVAMESAAPANGADEYSQTNVQVQGIDEADFVKNDGTYIYTITGDELVIVEAYPAEGAKKVSETDIDATPQQMFLNGDTIVVFAQRNEPIYTIPAYDFAPRPRYGTQTVVLVYDVSDRNNPELEQEYEITGNYFQARMIEDKIYLVTQEYLGYDYIQPPVILERGATIVEPDVYYFENPSDDFQFSTITILDLENNELEAETFLMGSASTMYMSYENIYLAYQKQWEPEDRETVFFDIIYPLLPTEAQQQITESMPWQEIAAVLEETYNSMSEGDRTRLIKTLEKAHEEYEIKRAIRQSGTIIHKLGIEPMEYNGRAEVPGTLLNQFSMDEADGLLRVATTTNAWTREKSIQHNNVYVLEDMEIVGRLEGLAENERIYSTRFMQNRLYMVTFERIDPLFVIDLEDPRNPEVLGELKIPGFSDYLHPYDDTHLIGIGKETKENTWGGVSTLGLKISLFDVSDVANPEQVDVIVIGEAGTSSEALQDHKAFLFDRERDLLVLPVREVRDDYNRNVWHGAYIFNVTADQISVRGKVAHFEGEDRWGYWGSPNAVRRSMFMDDVLYTIGNRYIGAYDLDSLDEITKVRLPYTDRGYYPIW